MPKLLLKGQESTHKKYDQKVARKIKVYRLYKLVIEKFYNFEIKSGEQYPLKKNRV